MFKPGTVVRIDIKGWDWNIVGFNTLCSNLNWTKDNGKIGILVSEHYHGLPFNARIKYWKVYLNNKFANTTEKQFKIL